MVSTIFINGRFLTKAITGVQRYAFELLSHFDILLEEAEYRSVKLVCLTPHYLVTLPAWKNIEIRQIGQAQGNLWEQIDLPFHARRNLLFSPANTGPFYYSNQVLTFHDASTFAFPDAYSFAFRAKYQFLFKTLVRTAKLIFTDSLFSQRELAHYLRVPVERFLVIPLGGDHFKSIKSDPTILEKCGISSEAYFLTVASQSRHKNFSCILDAARILKSKVNFVAVGGKFQQVFHQNGKIERETLPPNVQSLGYLNDSQVKALYENALGFIFPSLYEGFGLPVLEAMNCACPVLCSAAASLPEVGGEAVLYFDPLDANSLVSTIEHFLGNSDPALKFNLRAKALKHAEHFTWEKTARQTLKALISCL
jgi:glycosyltransferase involved in cell wall biosynthesis